MQEIVVIAAIALAIFFLPRLTGGKAPRLPEKEPPVFLTILTGKMRLAILLTLFWIGGLSVFFVPWEKESDAILFLLLALGPVAALWGGFWVWSGFRKYRR